MRAFAVLPVILFHAGFPAFAGGYVGVDIFFVISGYLITGILAREMDEGRYSLLTFYERRARRILPALVAMIAVVTVACWWILPPLEMQWYGESVAATALFVANGYFLYRGGNYFSGFAEEFPLLHTWSLAVEEQFYLFFPLLLWACWRFGRRRLIAVIAALCVASFLTAEILSRIDLHPYNFYLLPSRIWELGVGSLGALVCFRSEPTKRPMFALAGLALIVGSVLLLDDGLRFPSAWAIPPVLGTLLVLLYARPENATGRFLALKPLVWVGLISYSSYLWHQPLFALARVHLNEEPGAALLLALSALSLLLGYASYRIVETPFRRRGTTSSAKVVLMSGGVLAATALLGVFLHYSLGASFRQAPGNLPRDYYEAVAKPNFPSRGLDWSACSDFCTLVSAGPGSRRVLLVGDSHSQDLIPELKAQAERHGWKLDLYVNTGCSYTRLSAYSASCNAARDRLLAGTGQNYDNIILINRLGGLVERLDPGEDVDGAARDYAALVEALLRQGGRVTVLAPRPELSELPVRAAISGHMDHIAVVPDDRARAFWDTVLAKLPESDRLTVFGQTDLLLGMGCGEASCFNGHTADNYPIFRDEHHLSPFAAKRLVDTLVETLGS